ncbi:MAG: ethanolamine utilization protein EutN [Rhodothermales bacterium]|jgi:ethanolamine utilization protein EutN
MRLCRVIGTTVASRKDESFRTSKLLVVQPIRLDGSAAEERDMLALDPGFGAGDGDVVLVATEGSAARHVTGQAEIPANVVVLGVVDEWSVEE